MPKKKKTKVRGHVRELKDGDKTLVKPHSRTVKVGNKTLRTSFPEKAKNPGVLERNNRTIKEMRTTQKSVDDFIPAQSLKKRLREIEKEFDDIDKIEAPKKGFIKFTDEDGDEITLKNPVFAKNQLRTKKKGKTEEIIDSIPSALATLDAHEQGEQVTQNALKEAETTLQSFIDLNDKRTDLVQQKVIRDELKAFNEGKKGEDFTLKKIKNKLKNIQTKKNIKV